jgi:hypothetical protein
MPSSHLELAKICSDVFYTDFDKDGDAIYGQESERLITMRQVEGLVFGVTQVDFASPLAGVVTVTCICFRGSQEVQDFLIDADAFQVETPAGKVHSGFRLAWQTIRIEVINAATRCNSPYIIFTGHSLGGAIATLAAIDFYPQNVLEVITFGCPRIGDKAFAKTYEPYALRTVRYVYQLDPVPWIPLGCNGYHHVVHPTWWDGEKWLPEISWVSMFRAMLRVRKAIGFQRKGRLFLPKEGWFDKMKAILQEHKIYHYIDALS